MRLHATARWCLGDHETIAFELFSDEWLYRGEWTGLVISRPTETESVTRNVEREIVTSIRNVAASVPKGVDNPVRRYCMT